MNVYVLDINGSPLMPTTPSRARRMLRDGKAKVESRTPFTVKLLYEPEAHEVQPVSLGVKPSYDNVKLSATTESEEVYMSTVLLRTDIPNKIETRRSLRRTRRNRLRYRPARWQNRAIPKGWFPPSTRQKLDAYIKAIENVKKILPVSNIIVEIGSYDIRKLIDKNIAGEEYQKPIINAPELLSEEELEEIDDWNIREYVMARDKFKCRCCKGKSGDKVLGVHHLKDYIHTDKPDPKKHYSVQNTITVCNSCHEKIHSGELECKAKNRGFKAEAFANSTKYELIRMLQAKYPDQIKFTFGYITKSRRIKNNVSAEDQGHTFAIAGNFNAKRADEFFLQKKIRCHDRSIFDQQAKKGGVYRRRQSPQFMNGFKMYDKVIYDGNECFVTGRDRKGYVVLNNLDKTIKYHACARMDKVKIVERGTCAPIERRTLEKQHEINKMIEEKKKK